MGAVTLDGKGAALNSLRLALGVLQDIILRAYILLASRDGLDVKQTCAVRGAKRLILISMDKLNGKAPCGVAPFALVLCDAINDLAKRIR